MQRRTKFGFAHASGAREAAERSVLIRPLSGLHTGITPTLLPASFTPEARNCIIQNGFLRQRSGLSQFGAFDLKGPVIGAAEVFDTIGDLGAVAASTHTIAFIHPSSNSWSVLSYVRGSTLTQDDLPSSTSRNYWDIATIFDPALEQNIVVLTNNAGWPKYFVMQDSWATFSDFTFFNDLATTQQAKAVATINNRLVFFNTLGTGASTDVPSRVLWSARGNPTNFSILDGAGFEDLVEMRGEPNRLLVNGDHLVLFTTEQVWVGRPTLDDYAFRFYKIVDSLGEPYARTAVTTPIGVIFLGRDHEVYIIQEAQVRPIGIDANGVSRIRTYIDDVIQEPTRSWAIYNALERRYELYFPTPETTDGYPRRALFYEIDNDIWMPQTLPLDVTIGCDMEDTQALLTWDDLNSISWGSLTQTWGQLRTGATDRHTLLFSSNGTPYRLRSDQSTDYGNSIDVRYRTAPLQSGRDFTRQEAVTEVWVDYQADSASSLTVRVVADHLSTTSREIGINLPANTVQAFAPVWQAGTGPVVELLASDGGSWNIGALSVRLRDTSGRGGAR